MANSNINWNLNNLKIEASNSNVKYSPKFESLSTNNVAPTVGTIVIDNANSTSTLSSGMSSISRGQHQLFPYHLVGNSPWPVTVSFSLMACMLNLGMLMHGYLGSVEVFLFSVVTLLFNMTLWFRDIISEGTYLGDHTIAVRKGILLGFWQFVISEILIFAAIFWAYFHSAMGPSFELGSTWPPIGIQPVSPMELPLLNTIMLLASGATVTFSHHATLKGWRKSALIGLFFTVILIVLFVACQYLEYMTSSFSLSDGVYGSVFYAGTGLHFLHMVMLIAMLAISYVRMYNYHYTTGHHVGYETTILYLHVLDVIWLFLYVVMYWWGV